jgi:hypothetical protein
MVVVLVDRNLVFRLDRRVRVAFQRDVGAVEDDPAVDVRDLRAPDDQVSMRLVDDADLGVARRVEGARAGELIGEDQHTPGLCQDRIDREGNDRRQQRHEGGIAGVAARINDRAGGVVDPLGLAARQHLPDKPIDLILVELHQIRVDDVPSDLVTE